ncbi:hypothetical protein [Rosenbergiella epipactidis]|uniref:hypothetical protein n=1 Tax=Rosenbergiella epipactidis TaxID=1544694 RepID=UPI001F4EFE23|nr:hypothetical protein [Rosenbergiella epipactidis]
MFGIFPNDKPVNIEGECVLPALIVIDEFSESLNIPISYWNIEDYRKSWAKSIIDGIRNSNHAVLAVSMYEPGYANFVFTWVLYFVDQDVFVQNKIIFLEDNPGFTPERINDFVHKRNIYDEDGQEISEWKTDLKNVNTFLSSLL